MEVSSGLHFIGEQLWVGGILGLLGLQQGPHLADLPLDTGFRCATQGTVLFHAVSVVPHMTHIA